MTRGDAVVIALVCCAIVASAAGASMLASTGSLAVVEVDGTPARTVMLDTDERVTVTGTRGDLTVEVKGGRVAIVRADCPNQVCVRTGWRSHAGDAIICVPNRTTVRIKGARQQGIHGVTG
jgi:heptaprenyl diphosphate synthase